MTVKSDPAEEIKNRAADNASKSAAPSAEASTLRSEQQHQPETNVQPANTVHDRKHWLEYATAAFALVAALGSISAVIVGYWQWSAMSDSNVASTRAWLTPTGAYFDGEPKSGFNVRLKITYENIGKEAADDAVPLVFWSPGTFPVTIDAKQMAYIDLQTAPWPVLSDSVCRVDPSRYINRRAVYPGAKNEFITYGFNDPPYLPEGVIDGKEFFSIFGCLVYRSPITGARIHHSPFCLYYQPKRDGSIKDGTFEFCPSGSANAN